MRWKLIRISLQPVLTDKYDNKDIYNITESFQGDKRLYFLTYINESVLSEEDKEMPPLINVKYPGSFGTVEYIDFEKTDVPLKKRRSIGVLRFEVSSK